MPSWVQRQCVDFLLLLRNEAGYVLARYRRRFTTRGFLNVIVVMVFMLERKALGVHSPMSSAAVRGRGLQLAHQQAEQHTEEKAVRCHFSQSSAFVSSLRMFLSSLTRKNVIEP